MKYDEIHAIFVTHASDMKHDALYAVQLMIVMFMMPMMFAIMMSPIISCAHVRCVTQ